MKPILRTVALCTLAMTLTGGMAFAQDHHDDRPRTSVTTTSVTTIITFATMSG